MGKPAALLPAIDAELLQPSEEVVRQSGCAPALVGQREHADASRLPVAGDLEHRPCGGRRGRSQLCPDRRCLARRARTEKRERDVQVVTRDESGALIAQGAPLPIDDAAEDVVGQTECTEEPLTVIAADATRSGVSCLYQLRVNCLRTRCSAATAARERIACRSAG